MIKKVRILDNDNLPFSYLKDLEAFENGKTYEFKPGVNIIVGENGSGKSSFLKLLSMYFLNRRTFYSEIISSPNNGTPLSYDSLFDENNRVKDGISIESDFRGVAYNFNAELEEMSLDFIKLKFETGQKSEGESRVTKFMIFMDTAFQNKNINFPLTEILNGSKTSNSLWATRYNSLLEFYQKNGIKISPSDFEYTFFVDEPDRNLDISHIDQLYNILSFHKELTQLIVVIHNPILIYKLSKKKDFLDLNIIEFSEGYLDKIERFFNNL